MKKVWVTVTLTIAAAVVIYQGTAMAEIQIRKAEWDAEKQRLVVRATETAGKHALVVNYGGRDYPMRYRPGRERYDLRIRRVCYDDRIGIASTSGAVIFGSVSAESGSPEGYECALEPVCPDADGDGYLDRRCGGSDCNDNFAGVNPGAVDTCGDDIDQDCSGTDATCGDAPHADLRFQDYPHNCLSCHANEASEIANSTHYRWLGEAPDMVNATEFPQGKLTNAVNSYCINILGNWPVCGACHIGLGKRPDDPAAGHANIDCLMCHNASYATQRVRLPDGSMGVTDAVDDWVRSPQKPTRANCLACHAKAGGGDGVKRGDLSLATATNTDPHFDVHMNTGGANLDCQSCHIFENHKVIGKGSDIRPTDDLARGAEVSCVTCHKGKDLPGGHPGTRIDDHVARVSCQTCHIPIYAKVATEVHRDWSMHHDGTPADGISGPGHPHTEMRADLIPVYRFWNRLSDNYLLGDDASRTYNVARDTYPTSQPVGSVEDPASKIYPFKYKTAHQPKTTADDRLIALDTFEYLKASGDVDLAVENGLVNMGYAAHEPYEWIVTDTYQLINHGVMPDTEALQCSSCHSPGGRMDLQGSLGYAPKASTNKLCTQCHEREEMEPFEKLHNRHVREEQYDCAWCHTFTRPERGLRAPGA